MISFTDEQLAFIQSQRVGRLATADRQGQPHVIPVCYACDGRSIYIALDAKPKRVAPQQLRRVRNLLENPRIALVVDRYSDDWSVLAYVLIRGSAELLGGGDEQLHAVGLLRDRYVQYQTMPIQEQPIIAIRPSAITSWGALSS
ncbi:MAG TPA: TIGR03668 family PPOX class F420-dependent oxidoreductase [Herpetosiphonaceae bacterium]